MPFCPNCQIEFQDWVKTCPDCGIDLIAELPPTPKIILDKLITICTYNHPEEAYLNQALLQSEDIQSFIFDDFIITLSRLFALAIGGVKIKVRENDAETAIQIIQKAKDNNFEPVDNDGEICPECNSIDTRYKIFSLRAVFLSWFLVILFLGHLSTASVGIPLGFPLPFIKRCWRCNNCGHEFKDNKS